MRREEALALSGQHVQADTVENGSYVGIIQDVIAEPRRPWRARVLITGVIETAEHMPYEHMRFPVRRGFRPGEEIQVGGKYVSLASSAGSTYLEVLEGQIAKDLKSLTEEPGLRGHTRYIVDRSLQAYEIIARRERRRIETGEWTIDREHDGAIVDRRELVDGRHVMPFNQAFYAAYQLHGLEL